MPSFDAAFRSLNPAQRIAAETIEGPVLIVAGPGTGKTQTLALRLANILQKTQARPHNLLALTFTESAAIELKKRLAEFIGADAYGITASTFHAFAARLEALFPAEFATTRERIQIDELRRSQLFREILEAGEYPLLRPLRAPELYLRALPGVISNLKREKVLPAKLREIYENEKTELANSQRINPRTQKPFGKIITAEKKIAKGFELADFFESYEKLLVERGLADYDDLILSVVAKLENPADEFLLAYLQENFLYVTVDEFQDTNGAQNAILKAWASYDAKPNLCVVGDDDQSIYRFQGASLANILEFTETYKSTQIVSLTQNYRSTKPILDCAAQVIVNNEERLVNRIAGISKKIEAVETSPKSIAKTPRLASAASEMDEASFVLAEVQQLLKKKTPASEIAVIYRNRFHGDVCADFFARAGVPVFRADGQDALVNVRVRQLIQLLRAVADPADAPNNLATFFADFSEIPTVEVYRLTREVDFSNSFLDLALRSKVPEAQKFGEKLLDFQKQKATQNLLEFVENVAAGSGLTPKIAAAGEYESAEAVAAFLAFVRNFTISHEEASLATLLADLAAMKQQRIALPLPARAHDAVTFTTAHRAKGREWMHVFVIRCADEAWGGTAPRELLKLPALATVAVTSENEKEQRIEDERRLFYVSLTRAKTMLTLSVAAEYNFRPATPSRFLAEIGSAQLSPVSVPTASFAALPLKIEKPLDPDSRKYLASLVEHYRLSPTALNNYLTCPRKFLLQNLLRLPPPADADARAGAIFGSAIHAAFEEFFREFKKTGVLPDQKIAFTALEKSLAREPLTAVQRERIRRDATVALEKYFAFHTASFAPPVEVEYNFARHDVRLDDIPLTGKVDRIDFIPETKNEVSLVDYKSMQPLSSAQIRGETANSTGNAYRQLQFYLLLAELDSRFVFRPRQVRLSFVRPSASGEFRDTVFAPSKQEIEDLKKLIRESFAKIRALEFACTEDTADCRRCGLRELCSAAGREV